jgi:hypothetical protein
MILPRAGTPQADVRLRSSVIHERLVDEHAASR